ncbi:MAG: DUF354 domain-containing protein, partial [Ignavibacterium sp.]|nr:DUF354 domain-containing protein [Ignavibacterium sp.]MDW8374574.1 DUF354 domain-containing protein [Ignavibacteriales bacterium]
LFIRAKKLKQYIRNRKINLAISHGSRTQILSSKISNIRSIAMMDYEYTESKLFNYFSNYLLFPKFLPEKRLKDAGFNLKKIIRYDGFKEEIYLNYFKPDLTFRNVLGLSENDVLVVLRPPSIVSNYHDKKSETFLIEVLNHLKHFKVKVFINYRTNADKNYIINNFKINENFIFMEKPVDGLQLLYNADLVISGGGTMNREAALLGTPTYSIFTGKRPYLDEYLSEMGRLSFINKIDDIKKIEPKRLTEKRILTHSQNLANELVELFLDINNKRI